MTKSTITRDPNAVVAPIEQPVDQSTVVEQAPVTPTEGLNFGKGMTMGNTASADAILAYMRAEAERLSKTLTATGADIIRAKQNKHFILPNDETATELEAIILAWVSVNTYYDKPYVQDKRIPPVCAALNEEVELMTPQADAPQPQNSDCNTCAKNQYRSGANGKGKACRNARRISILLLNGGASVDKAPLFSMECPPTTIRHIDRYIQTVSARCSCLPFAVRTRISLDKEQTYSTYRFELMGVLTNEEIFTVYNRIDEGKAAIKTPVNFIQG